MFNVPELHTSDGYEKVRAALPKIKGIENPVHSSVVQLNVLEIPFPVSHAKHIPHNIHVKTCALCTGIIQHEIEKVVDSLSIDTFEDQQTIQVALAQETGLTIEFVGKSKGCVNLCKCVVYAFASGLFFIFLFLAVLVIVVVVVGMMLILLLSFVVYFISVHEQSKEVSSNLYKTLKRRNQK